MNPHTVQPHHRSPAGHRASQLQLPYLPAVPTLPALPALPAALVLLALLLAACQSPPQPPTVDESTRRPANTPQSLAKQSCQIALNNSRIEAGEARQQAALASATAAHLAARHQVLASLQASALTNRLHTVAFGFNSTRFTLEADAAAELLADAKDAPLVVVRGVVSGADGSAVPSRLAQARALAARNHLVAAGVQASRIRLTYQSNQPPAPHTDSAIPPIRKVEVEIYRALPMALPISLPVTQAAPAAPPSNAP